MIVEEKRASDFNCCQRTKQTTKYCEGSRCMAWRWTDEVYDEDNRIKEVGLRQYGYCGLAGRP